jgi:rubrerythrin
MLIALAFAVALGLAFFVAKPLLAAGSDEGTLPVDVTLQTELKRRRLVVYDNIQDLEFEYRARKIAPKDYEALRETYTAEAARLVTESHEVDRQSTEELFIEREVAARRAHRQAEAVPDYTCPKCGFENPVPVKFCGECGARLGG